MASALFSADVSALQGAFKIISKSEFRGETTLVVERGAIKEICRYAKETLGYTYLVDLSGVDNFGTDPRYEVVYELYQFARGDSLRLKLSVSEDELEVDTVSDIWPTADWHEREVYDMFGLRFRGHPDLRRILMWEGYPFFPLRKDFPLAGRPSDMPDVGFTRTAPMEGGPYVTVATTLTTKDREPRSRASE